MADKGRTQRFRVWHDANLDPDDWKRFVEFTHFTNSWRALGLADEDLRALQIMLVMHPEMGSVVPGTGGLRKVRFARAGKSKSGGLRVGYAYFEEFGIICLIVAYAKQDQADIPQAIKGEIRNLLGRVRDYLARR